MEPKNESGPYGDVAKANNWGYVVYLKDADKKKLKDFPLSSGRVRNLATGKNRDERLASKIFHVGKYPAILCEDLVDWLNSLVTRRG